MSQGFGYTYNKKHRTHRDSECEVYETHYQPLARKTESFREECLRAAKSMSDLYDNNLTVLLSGGADCEIVARSLKEVGASFKAVTVRFLRSFNQHDVDKACEVVEDLKVNHTILDLDIEAFFETSKAHYYAGISQCSCPILLSTIWAMDQVDGIPILGAGDAYIAKENYQTPESPWYFCDEELWSSYYKLLAVRGKTGIPEFFQWSPELIYSFITHPKMIDLVNNRIPEARSCSEIKYDIYHDQFDLIHREEQGYHGFENLFELYSYYAPYFIKKYSNQEVRFEYHEFVAKLEGEVKAQGQSLSL